MQPMRDRLGSVRDRPTGDWRKLVLTAGFLAVAIGTISAWQTPATGYEVSVYAGTPRAFWVGAAVGLLSAALVTLASCRDRNAGVAVGLGLLTTITIGALPVIRSFRFYGRSDSLTHLGWATEIMTGRMRFGDLFYPAGHSIAALVRCAVGVPIERVMILFAALCFALYTIFIPLTAKALFEDRRLTVIAAFSGTMVLPINQISNGLYFHTYSMAMLLFPVFLYALVKHLTSAPTARSAFDRIGSWNLVLAILGITLVVTHPQLALNIVILLGTLVVLHVAFRNREKLVVSDLRPVYGVFVLLLLVWLVWVLQFDKVFNVGERVLVSTYEAIIGTTDPGESVETQVQSARAVEATLLELFVKLFLVPATYSVLALLAVLLQLRIPFTDGTHRDAKAAHNGRSVITYFGYAGLVLGPFFLAHFMGPVSHLFFRHYGFAMVFVTILGAVMIHHLASWLSTSGWRTMAKPVAIGILVVALALSLSTIFASPFIYNASHHVTDQHFNGFETAIEHSSDDIQWSGIRRGPGREFDALAPGVGMYTRPAVSTGASTYGDQDLDQLLSGEFEEVRYLPVSEIDRDREVIAYRELRYSTESFESIGTRSGVHHIQDNGGFDLYYVTPRNSETGQEISGT